jgi:hypothetical protein
MTDRNQAEFAFQGLGSRKVAVDFRGGQVSSDGGGLLLREVEQRRGWIRDFAECFEDHRDARWVEHSVRTMAGQRIFGLALGYEDLNDHEHLRADPLLAVLCEKADPTGADRIRAEDKGKPLAGKSTLNRLEHGQGPRSRYKKVVLRAERVPELLVAKFIDRHREPPQVLVLDLDATDDPLHGKQEGRFFHGYYDGYCYLPLYIFCGDDLLCAKLRPANIDASEGALAEVQRIVAQLRDAWPAVRVVLRADSGFAREEIMSWCEAHAVDYLFGLARNGRLEAMLAPAMDSARRWSELLQQPVRVFTELVYQTLKTWGRPRRVVGKAEYLAQGANPRFVVTSLPVADAGARELYEVQYCARGEMENRIKEQQLDLFADRTSTATMQANQLRLWLSAIAYGLLNDLRVLGLQGTQMAQATCGTIRTRLLKIGALIRVSVRRVLIQLASSCPVQEIFAQTLAHLRVAPADSS